MVKKYFIYLLSILFLSGSLHFDQDVHSHTNEHNICNVDCKNEHHHSMSHQCEKCLIKINNLIFAPADKFYSNFQDILYIINYDNHIKDYLIFNLYSRPPPFQI